MARYTVVWPKELDDAYLEVWLRSDSTGRALLTTVSHLIQAWLGNIPANVGRPIHSAPGMRAWILPTDKYVSVVYHVNEPDRLVTIVRLSVRM